MKIDSYNMVMASQYNYQETSVKNESLRVWVNPHGSGSGVNAAAGGQDILTLSDQALALMEQDKTRGLSNRENDPLEGIREEDKQKLFLIQKMIELLTGKKIKFYLPKGLKLSANAGNGTNTNPGLTQVGGAVRRTQGWGMEYQRQETYLEQERLSFAAGGIVRTQDGREINFSVQLSMSRTFAQQTNISIRAGDAPLTDPLVINFNGTASQLTNTKFAFDLDLDGTPDQISFVNPSSGFLALDINGDGIINDGRELFGPSTGNGFAELAQHDSDGNGWIDENDPVYSRLRIWTKDAGGNDKLFALGEKGVGAIFVGHLQTPFAMKDESNELHGQVRSTGIYLNEDGTPGTIQQIDLVV